MQEDVLITGTAPTGAAVHHLENKPEIALMSALVLIGTKLRQLNKTALMLLQAKIKKIDG